MEVPELPFRPLETSILLPVAIIDASVTSLAQSRGLSYERGFRSGLGPYIATAIDLPSGRQCLLEEFEFLAGDEWAGVEVSAEPLDDQDEALEAVLDYFGLDESVVKWVAPRPFHTYSRTICVLSTDFATIADELAAEVKSNPEPTSSSLRIAEADIGGTQLLLVERPENDLYSGVEVRSRWQEDPGHARRVLLDRLGVDGSSVTWTPDDAHRSRGHS
jgi:hypothetical protein